MNPLFQRILNAYLQREGTYSLYETDYNLLPLIFPVATRNNLDLSKDYETEAIYLPARANAKNITIAERMRAYAQYRTTK